MEVGRTARRVGRRVRAQAGFYATAVGCLAAGVGAATAVVAVADAVLLRPLPYPQPEELVFVRATLHGPGSGMYLVSPANYLAMRDGTTAFSALEAARGQGLDLRGDAETVRLSSAAVTPGFLAALGAVPLVGRLPGEADGPGSVALSEGLWTRRFGRDPEAVGRTVVLGGAAREIVGVVRSSQAFPPDVEVWVPWRAEETPERDLHGGGLQVIGRLASGVTLEAAQADMDRVAADLRRLYPDQNTGRGIVVDPLREPFVSGVRGVLQALLAAVGLLLVIACGNVAALMLVRVRRRAAETALRTALGAPRSRLVREAAWEGAGIAVAGAAGGLLLAAVSVPPLAARLTQGAPGVEPGVGDLRVLAFVMVAALLTAVTFSAGPALLATRISPAGLLRSAGRAGSASRGQRTVQGGAVAGQAALGVLLVAAAAASLDSVLALVRVEPGFDGTDAMTFRVPLPEERYPDAAARNAYLAELREALLAVPGARAVGATDVLPVGDPGVNWAFSVEDRPPADPASFEVARGRLVTPGYFEALGIPLRAGRSFDPRDGADAPPVVVVSRAMAERYWPGEDPLGRRIKRRAWDSPFPWMTVVGVVGDVRDGGPSEEVGPTLYLAYDQHDTRLGREMSFVVGADRDPAELAREGRQAIAGVDPRTPVTRVVGAGELVAESFSAQRTAGTLLSGFAAAALLLLAVGVYGVMARAVQERTREVGLRMALGARPWAVVVTVARGSAALLLLGVGVGALVAPAAVGGAAALLGGGARPPAWAYALGAVLTVAVGGIASAMPTWRAVRVDPLVALRQEG